MYLNFESSGSRKKKSLLLIPAKRQKSYQNSNHHIETKSFHRLVLRHNIIKHKNQVDNFIHLFNVHFHNLFSFNNYRSAPSEGQIKPAGSSSTEEHNWSSHPLWILSGHCQHLQVLIVLTSFPGTTLPSPQTSSVPVLQHGFPGGSQVHVITLSPILSHSCCPRMALPLTHALSCVWAPDRCCHKPLALLTPAAEGIACPGVTLGPWLILPWEQPHRHCSLTNRTKVYWTYSKVSSG